jgi:DNA-binding response OmpR family regulator
LFSTKGTQMSDLGVTKDAAPAVLMCGLRPLLLESRKRLLQRAGFAVHLADSVAEAEKRLSQGRYFLVLICHSVQDGELEALRTIASQARVSTYRIEPLTPPETLIEEVNRMLQRTWASGAA